jgi:hypothetical protein
MTAIRWRGCGRASGIGTTGRGILGLRRRSGCALAHPARTAIDLRAGKVVGHQGRSGSDAFMALSNSLFHNADSYVERV